MLSYPYSYGDSLTETEARANLENYLSQYGTVIFLSLLTPLSAIAIDKGKTPESGATGSSKGLAPTTAPAIAPVPGKAALLPGQQAQPPVLRTNLPPSSKMTGKASLVGGVSSLSWCAAMAAATGNPALYIAAAALSIYFLS
jgi:hypothetical protein